MGSPQSSRAKDLARLIGHSMGLASLVDRSTMITRVRSGTLAHLLLVSGVVLIVSAATVHAQINPFKGYRGPTLNKQDLALGGEAARKLLDNDQAEIGKSETWTNPDTGHRGTITVLGSFQRQGMACRSVKSLVEYKPPAKPRTLTLRFCRLPTGEWKLL